MCFCTRPLHSETSLSKVSYSTLFTHSDVYYVEGLENCPHTPRRVPQRNICYKQEKNKTKQNNDIHLFNQSFPWLDNHCIPPSLLSRPILYYQAVRLVSHPTSLRLNIHNNIPHVLWDAAFCKSRQSASFFLFIFPILICYHCKSLM